MRGLLFFGRRILIAAILERTVFLEPTEWRITVDEGRKPIQDSQAAKQNVVQKPFSSAGVARKGLLFLRERWPRATVLPFPQFHIAVDLLLKSRRQNFFALGGRQYFFLLDQLMVRTFIDGRAIRPIQRAHPGIERYPEKLTDTGHDLRRIPNHFLILDLVKRHML